MMVLTGTLVQVHAVRAHANLCLLVAGQVGTLSSTPYQTCVPSVRMTLYRRIKKTHAEKRKGRNSEKEYAVTPRRESNAQPPDLESGALPLRHTEARCNYDLLCAIYTVTYLVGAPSFSLLSRPVPHALREASCSPSSSPLQAQPRRRSRGSQHLIIASERPACPPRQSQLTSFRIMLTIWIRVAQVCEALLPHADHECVQYMCSTMKTNGLASAGLHRCTCVLVSRCT